MMVNWDEIEKEVVENNRRLSDSVNPETLKRKSEEEFQKGVRLGWWDQDGNNLLPKDDEEDDDDRAQE